MDAVKMNLAIKVGAPTDTSNAGSKLGTLCVLPQTNRGYRILFWVVSALVVFAVAFPYVIPLFY